MANVLSALIALAISSLGASPAEPEAELSPQRAPIVADCALATPRSRLSMALEHCPVAFSDTAALADPIGTWGPVACESENRQQRPIERGDPARRADGEPQRNSSYRLLRVIDGDDFYGERCELGENDSREGPTALFREGMRRATYASLRLPQGFPLDVDHWQNVLQLKQTQPADNGGGTPVLSLKAFDGRWFLFHSDAGPTDEDFPIWSTRAAKGGWTRFAFDITYSADPDRGSIKLYADLNGDGDFADVGEESPTFITNTLKRETDGDSSDGYTVGDPLPSHLRAGIYHDPVIPCPAPAGCAIEIDNVQVLAP